MSLKLGKAFVAALKQDTALMSTLGASTTTVGRLFMVGRPTEDDAEDKIPYIIITPTGISSEGSEDDYEQIDVASMEVLVVAEDYPALVDLTEKVRADLEERLLSTGATGYNFTIQDYTFSAGAVALDPDKPCFYQTLTYQCSTQKS